MSEKLNIYQKLSKIRDIADAVKRDMQGFGYKYSDITEILAKVKGGMKKYGVSLIPSIVPETASVEKVVSVDTKIDKQGETYDKTSTEMLFTADMCFRWVNDDEPNDFIEVPWFVAGAQSDPSQATGSGLTYTQRYFLTSYFQIAQTFDDPDNYRSKQKEAEKAEDKAIAEELIEQLDTVVKKFLAENEDKKDDVKRFIGKYVKGGNYFKIKDPEVASKLLNEFKNTYLKEEKNE